MSKILAIDDNRDDLIFISALLNALIPGCTLTTARSGSEGLKMAINESPDTILLDIMMPGMDGFEVCKRLKSDEKTMHIPVIMLTAIKTDPESRIKGLDIGADAFLAKPIDKGELASQVKVALRIKKAEELLRKEKDLLKEMVQERTGDLLRVNRALKTIIESNKAIVNAADEPGLLDEICRIIVETGGYRMAWVGFARQDEDKTVRPMAQAGFEEGYLDKLKITWADTQHGQGPIGRAIRERKPVVNRDVLTNPDYLPWRAEAIKHGYASSMALPIIGGDKSPGALNVYASEPDAFDDEEIKLLTELADGLAFGIMALRTSADRKRAEDERKESEEKYRNIFNNAQVGIFQTSISDGKVLECNDRFARTYGYKTAEECKANCVLSEHYTDPGTREKMLASLIEEGEVNNFEACLSLKDGEAVWTRFSARAYPEEGYLEGVGYDITEEKRGLDALRESEAQYRLLAEKVTDVIWTMDMNLRFTYISPSVTSLTGYGVDETMALSLEEILTPASLEIVVKTFGEELAADETQMSDAFSSRALELEQRRKDGSTFWAETTATFLRDPDGRTIGLLGVTRDINERKQAQEALINEKERFRVLTEDSPLGIVTIRKDGHYEYINPAFIEIFGYGLEEIPTGKEWFRKAFPNGEYRHQVISTWINDGRESKPGETRPRIFTVTCKDGSQKEIRFIPVMLESGDQFVIYDDMTEQKKLEAQLRQAQKMEAVGRLAGGVAHDFNNLLMTIMGYADLALMNLAGDDPLKRDLEEIKQGGKRAAALTRQLLAFSRKQILQPEVLDLNALITGFVKMLERLIGEDVELKTVLAPGLRRVEADPGQMEQVIMNLVINARDAMPAGGKLTIETANVDLDEDYTREHDVGLQPGPYVMLGVSDVGIGMDEETRSLIFEPFFTTKEEGKGTGLGLSTVYGIVKQSGGYIWVYSEPGQGTTFKIYLPAVEREATEVQKEQTSHHDLTGSETILIVEDDDALRKLACKMLEPQGYNILEAKNGIEALRVSEEHGDQIHLMIADAVMPKMGGRELAEHLRPLRPEMKVIYMSGYTDNAILRHGVLNPEIEFLQKPISSEALKRKVRKVLDA